MPAKGADTVTSFTSSCGLRSASGRFADECLARDLSTHAVADHRDLRRPDHPGQLIDRPRQLARTAHQAVAIVVGEAHRLLSMEGKHLRQGAKAPGRAVAAVHQDRNRLVGRQVNRAVRSVVAGAETRDLHRQGRVGQATRIRQQTLRSRPYHSAADEHNSGCQCE